jgi:hypothetical protein
MRKSYARPFDHLSPSDQPTTDNNVQVTTPSSAASPYGVPSPTTQVIIKESITIDRARMFALGQHEGLLKSLNGEERRYAMDVMVYIYPTDTFIRALSDWLYQYWLFCFKTAKHWGRGPKIWTAQLLKFDQFPCAVRPSLPGTPQNLMAFSTSSNSDGLLPSDLCQWHIHVEPGEGYIPIPEDQVIPLLSSDYEADGHLTWEPWLHGGEHLSLQTHLRDGLEHNDFSPIPAADLPVAIPQIAQAAKRSSDELLLECLGFSIMSRNQDQVVSVLAKLNQKGIKTTSLHPFHLATSFLDGAKSCCGIMYELARQILGVKAYEAYTNEDGPTILDNLMMTIIKSHSSAKPGIVDQNLKDVPRFVGEEVDICGRWDADSPCIRHLHASGNSSIPSTWKHKFCHTSLQAVCDCIIQMFTCMPIPLLLATQSGLYIRQCFD